MLALHQKLAAAAIPADKQLYQRQTWRSVASSVRQAHRHEPRHEYSTARVLSWQAWR